MYYNPITKQYLSEELDYEKLGKSSIVESIIDKLKILKNLSYIQS